MKTGTDQISSSIAIFRQYKQLADKAIAQAGKEELFVKPSPESNSMAVVMKHLAGNMRSRWTDFLNSDGEKNWRNRDSEFELTDEDRYDAVLAQWDTGWSILFNTLHSLSEADLGKIVTIRGEQHSVLEAINRQIAHYSYHVGQLVFIAKMIRDKDWNTLSIAKGKSNEFNKKMKST